MQAFEARTVADLVACHQAGARIKYVFFWGHTPARDGSINHSCFSQWYAAPFEADGHRFATAEHYMMFHKAMLFADQSVAEQVLAAASPGAAKALGRAVRGFDQAVWDAEGFAIVTEASYQKFSQHPELGAYLCATQQRVLVEASPKDAIWGIGLAADAEGVEDPTTWQGQNLLGFALMAARQRLVDHV